jgi:hypothetical protein
MNNRLVMFLGMAALRRHAREGYFVILFYALCSLPSAKGWTDMERVYFNP